MTTFTVSKDSPPPWDDPAYPSHGLPIWNPESCRFTFTKLPPPPPPTSPLPPDWEKRYTTDNHIFYFHLPTSTMSWSHPTLNVPRSTPSSLNPSPSVSRPTTPNPSTPLPAGWKQHATPQGPIFEHTLTHTRTHIDPRGEALQWSLAGELDKRLGPLPDGWEMRFVGERPYWVCYATKEASWLDPREVVTREIMRGGRMPKGWEARRVGGPGGRVYFADGVRRWTTWVDPRVSVGT